jgi:glycosyltransferase involved in cell wall biosynthesis
MRILMLAQFYPPVIGGEERHVAALSEALVERGHDVAVATMPHPRRADRETIRGVEVHGVRGLMQRFSGLFSEQERPHAPPFPDPELMLRLAGLIREFQPDIVHGHNWLVHSVLPLKRPTGFGLVQTLHDYSLVCAIKTLTRDDARCPGPALSRCLPCSADHFGTAKGAVTLAMNTLSAPGERWLVDKFLTVSTAVAEHNRLAESGAPFEVVHNFIPDRAGILPDERPACVDELPGEGFVLFVGDLNRRKGVHVILDAYRRLVDPPPLVMIGRRCEDTPADIPPGVQIFESWPHAGVLHAWNRCLFGLVPSTWLEPCATVVMEANAFGKPVIATRHGGFLETVDH